MTATIALFTYNRPHHTQRTIESLARNHLANKSDLVIFSDAAKNEKDQAAVNAVREYLPRITGFNTVNIRLRNRNFGLAKSIISGVTEILNNEETVIVLEDDMLTSPYFLDYMNNGLDKYVAEEAIISIHGYMYPVKSDLPEAFFIRGADCWGWATWARGWAHFNPDGKDLLNQLNAANLHKEFNFADSYPYIEMLESQIEGRNDSWAIRWYASAFLLNKLTLYPGISLVQNIGNDGSGTHKMNSAGMDVERGAALVNLDKVLMKENLLARTAISEYFSEQKGSWPRRVARKLKAMFDSTR